MTELSDERVKGIQDTLIRQAQNENTYSAMSRIVEEQSIEIARLRVKLESCSLLLEKSNNKINYLTRKLTPADEMAAAARRLLDFCDGTLTLAGEGALKEALAAYDAAKDCCPKCKGNGVIAHPDCNKIGPVLVACPDCRGEFDE